jgi:hypothetical protein
MGDNFAQEAISKGDIKVSMSMGGNEIVDVVLTSVLHVLRLAKKLFSITKATSLGHIFEFGGKRCVTMNKQKKVVELGLSKNGLY